MKPSFTVLARRIGRIANSTDTSFATLVYEAGLDPENDFKNADLVGVDFGSIDLAGYDFTDSDLSNANLRDVRNIESARLVGAKLDGAQLPLRQEDQEFKYGTKEELIELTERAARYCAKTALRTLLQSKSPKVQLLFADRHHYQGDLFRNSPEPIVHIRSLLIVGPGSISRTAIRQWSEWRPIRRTWFSARIVSPRPSPRVAAWTSKDEPGILLLAPMTFRNRAIIDLSNAIMNLALAGPTARMLGDVFAHFFLSSLDDLDANPALEIRFQHGQAREMAHVRWDR